MLRTEFTDSGHWENLAAIHLISYDLPEWTEPCSIEKMELWCDRLDLDYKAISNTSHEDFIRLNKDYPLRVFVGLLLEEKDGQADTSSKSSRGDG